MKFIKEDPLPVLLLLLRSLEIIQRVFLLIKPVELNKITILVLLVGEKKTELNIGLLEIHGEVTGERMEPLELLEELITSVLSMIVLGLHPLIHGQKILEMKLNPVQKNLNPNSPLTLRGQHANVNHLNCCLNL